VDRIVLFVGIKGIFNDFIKFLYPAACGVGFHSSYSNYFLEIAGRQA